MQQDKGELAVIIKMYDLTLWLINHTTKFPRIHRFALGQRIENTLYDLMDILIDAKYTKEKASLLRRANLALQRLRFQTRLAKDTRCLSMGSYEYGIRHIVDVGKQIGGWEKSIRGRR